MPVHPEVGRRRVPLPVVGQPGRQRGDEIAAGQVTVKDLDLGRQLADGVADNKAWRDERPGQITAPRADLVATVMAIVERAR